MIRVLQVLHQVKHDNRYEGDIPITSHHKPSHSEEAATKPKGKPKSIQEKRIERRGRKMYINQKEREPCAIPQ